MGGSNSGRWHGHIKRDTVEDCRFIDVNLWVREGVLNNGIDRSGTWEWLSGRTGEVTAAIHYEVHLSGEGFSWVRLQYTRSRTNEDFDYKIPIQWTFPHFGGNRLWFTCPLVRPSGPCNRRAAKLYLPPGGRYFGCRRCYHLSYESCNESHSEIALFASQYDMTPGQLKKTLRKAKGK